MSEKRREREMMRRAERQRRWKPGDDEFDVTMKGHTYLFGAWMIWAVIARGVRALRRQTL